MLLGPDGVEVDHEKDSDGIRRWIQAQDQLAELEGRAVAGSGPHKIEVPEQSDKESSGGEK